MEKKRTRTRKKSAFKVRLYSNGQYGLDAVLEHTGVTASELSNWRHPVGLKSTPVSRHRAKSIARLKSQIADLQRERQSARDAIAALAKAALRARPRSGFC